MGGPLAMLETSQAGASYKTLAKEHLEVSMPKLCAGIAMENACHGEAYTFLEDPG